MSPLSRTVPPEETQSLFQHTVSAYVLQVKVEMEMEIQQYEKAKAVREEQLDRLTQICQEQAVSPQPLLVSLVTTCYLLARKKTLRQPFGSRTGKTGRTI